MKIPGKITRLVEGKNKDGSDARVFIRPDDPEVLRKLDGGQYFASGEVAVTGKLDGLKVGDKHTIEVRTEAEV